VSEADELADHQVFFANPRSQAALKSRRNGIGTDMANLLGSPP
jgi:hypothetical protein